MRSARSSARVIFLPLINRHRVKFSSFTKNYSTTSRSLQKKNSDPNLKIHSSFYPILEDQSRGGLLLKKVIYHLHDQNRLKLPLFLSSRGIKASQDLINMLNLLPATPLTFGCVSTAGERIK